MFGGLQFKIGEVRNATRLTVGVLSGFVTPESRWWIGFGAFGVAEGLSGSVGAGQARDIQFNYFGVSGGNLLAGSGALALSAGSLVGFGALNYPYEVYSGEDWLEQYDFVFVLEPGIDLYATIYQSLYLSLGASYRLTTGVEYEGLDNADFSGPSAVIGVGFGSFPR